MRNYFLSKTMKLLVIITLIVSACVINATAETAQPEPVKLKVVALPYLSFAPFFIAQEEGVFTEQGILVEFVKMESMAQTIPLILQGQIDVTAGSINAGLFNAIARNGDLKIVADKGYFASAGCTNTAFVTRIDVDRLTKPEQVRACKFATSVTRAPGYYADKLLHTFGLTLQDVAIQDIPDANLADALRTGAIDVVSAGEPWLSLLLQDPQIKIWKKAQDVAPDFQLGVILYGPALLAQRPDIGQRFMAAYLKGVRQYNQGKTPRNIEILTKHTGVSPDVLRTTCWLAIQAQGAIHTDSVLDFQHWAMEQKLLDQIVPPERFWDGRFVEYANQMLGTSSK